MSFATLISIATIILFGVEIVGLVSGKLQEEIARKVWLAPTLLAACLLVMVALGDKMIGSGGSNFVIYGAILLFNASLFAVLWLKAILRKGHQDRIDLDKTTD